MHPPLLSIPAPEQLAALLPPEIWAPTPDATLDNLVRRAARSTGMPMASLSFFDPGDAAHAAREHFKSCYGTDLTQLSLTQSFLYANNTCSPLLVIDDTHSNPRLSCHPLVLQPPYLRSYAGAAVIVDSQIAIGVLSVYDIITRKLGAREMTALTNLAAMVAARVAARIAANQGKPRKSSSPQPIEPPAPAELVLAMQRLDLALAASDLAVWDWDLTTNRVYFNAHWGKLIGREGSAATFTDKEVLSWIHKDDREKFRLGMQNAYIGTTDLLDCEYRVLNAQNEWVWIYAQGMVTDRNTSGFAMRMNGTCANITKRKAVEERVEFLATRDPLTRLPNRMLLNDRLEQGIANAARKHSKLAFMFIDLDRFKTINDSLGHDVGDELLKSVAARLQSCVRNSDTVARLGGDEFAVIIENLIETQTEGPQNVAEKMITAMAAPMQINGHTLTTSCSIGISVFPDDGQDSQTLMKHADLAMYDAKSKGRNNYQFFSHALNARAQERLALENYLRLAQRHNELMLYYQPRIAFDTGKITAVEALLRWQHPRYGLLSPETFMPVAEDSGLIVPIGEWVLATAFTQLAAWQTKLKRPLKLAINLAAAQLLDGERLFRTLQQTLETSGFNPRQVELELTEGMLLKNSEETSALLNRLGKLGLGLTIDNFGTGHSSLSTLKRLPVKSIKVDGSFVRDIGIDPNDEAVIRAMIAMTHSLKWQVIAVGVESEQQFNTLRELSCDEFQGYYFARPMIASDFESYLLKKG